jgi:hypothetical protein
MVPIPEELLEQFERGNVLLFIGECISRDAKGQTFTDRLAAKWAARCNALDGGTLSFPEVTQAYEDEKGRHALVQFVRDQLEAWGDEPQPAHRLIARLTDCNVLVTTCLDRRLEEAFREAERPLDMVIGNVDVAFEDEHKARLYKLRGSVERAESLVLTEDDCEAFFEDQASVSVVLQGYLARKTILFVGYDLADPHFKRLYRKVTAPLDNYARRAYAFGETPSPRVSQWCKRHGIDVVEVDVTAFLETLTRQLAARARPTRAVPPQPVEEPSVPLPEYPYKYLDYYEARDQAIFFGRQQDTQRLSALIHAHRLVLLYGTSGAGKTSLLLAGVMPRLERAEPPYETVYVRALEDPTLAIRRTVRRRLPEADLPEDGPLVNLLDAASKALNRTLVIILDQFEEFFIRLSPQFRAAFIAELGALCDARDVPVKVVLSLREDWLASVSEIEARIPEVFRTWMRLLPLTRDQARQAITAPVERLGIGYEQALVERLLDDLAGSESKVVMPPQLQLVCSALYDGLEPDERQITLTAYERLGGARGVLQKYLDDELARLGSTERALARGVLEELVTSQGTKAVKAGDELALALDIAPAALQPVMDRLVRARLLRALEPEAGGTAYELAHEYLIREIGLGTEAQARKQAEELVQQEVENWRRFGTRLAADELALIGRARDVLKLNAEAWDLLLCSALVCNHEVTYWLARHPNPQRAAEQVLSFLMGADLKGEEKLYVIHIADELGRKEYRQAQWYPPLMKGLASCLASPDRAVQTRTREVLACMGPPPSVKWGDRLLTYLAGIRLLIPQYASQILLFGIGGVLGGMLSVVPLIPVGLWLGFLYLKEGQSLGEAVVYYLLILGPGMGIGCLLIGLGLGLGIVLGRGRSFSLETTISSIGGFVGGAMIAGYLCLFRTIFERSSPVAAMAAFSLGGALVAGPIAYCVRWMRPAKRPLKPGEVISQIVIAAAAGAAVGTLGDLILGTFPDTVAVGACFGAGAVTGLSWAERRSEIRREQPTKGSG